MSQELKDRVKNFKQQNGNVAFTTKEWNMLIYQELKEMREETKTFVTKSAFGKMMAFIVMCMGGLLTLLLKHLKVW